MVQCYRIEVQMRHLTERARDYLMVVAVGVIFFGAWPLIGQGKALALAASVYVFYAVISHTEGSRDDRFWLIIGGFACLHIAALLLISFPPEIRPGLIIFPFMLGDGFAMWALLRLVQRRA